MTSHGLTAAYTNLTDSNIDFKIINRAGKLHQLPPPLEFTEPHRPPPRSKSGRKTASTTPPRIHGTSSTTPRSKSGRENCINYPPRIHGTSSTTPLAKSGRKTASTTPPRIHGTSSTNQLPPPRNRAGKLHVPFLTDFASQNLTSMPIQRIDLYGSKFE